MNADPPKKSIPQSPRGWHSRGYLPHFDAGSEVIQFVTFRLNDSLPKQVIGSWRQELLTSPEAEREAKLHRLIEAFLDSGHGACHLRRPEIASIVEGALSHFDSIRYALLSWVVMPNRVHVLFTPQPAWSLSRIVGSWKSFTSNEANKVLARSGQFWQEDYFDRFVRNEHHLERVIEYIDWIPVKAGLCERPEDWLFGSARYRLGLI